MNESIMTINICDVPPNSSKDPKLDPQAKPKKKKKLGHAP
jgi:hypothetical protein